MFVVKIILLVHKYAIFTHLPHSFSWVNEKQMNEDLKKYNGQKKL